MRNPGTPADEEHFVPKLFSLSQFDEPGEVFDVDVLLGHYLGNEDRIGIFGPGTAQQLFRRHLGAEVDSVEPLIAFQAVAVVVAFHVHNGVDPHSVGVAFDAGANDCDHAAYVFTDIGVGGLHIHDGCFHHFDLDAGGIHKRRSNGVGYKMGVAFAHVAQSADFDLIVANVFQKQARCLFAKGVRRHGQTEGKLHLAVARGVAVGADHGFLAHIPSSLVILFRKGLK